MKHSPTIHAQEQAILPLQNALVCIMLIQEIPPISSVCPGTRPDQFIVVDSPAFHRSLSPRMGREGLCQAPGATRGRGGTSPQGSSLQT